MDEIDALFTILIFFLVLTLISFTYLSKVKFLKCIIFIYIADTGRNLIYCDSNIVYKQAR